MRISDWSSDVCSSDLAERKNTLPTFLPTSTNIHMRLWIAEKPDAGRQIAKALGGGNESGGHIKLAGRSEEHTSELQSLMRISYAVFCLKKKNKTTKKHKVNITMNTRIISKNNHDKQCSKRRTDQSSTS